jgi:hypothetical protein
MTNWAACVGSRPRIFDDSGARRAAVTQANICCAPLGGKFGAAHGLDVGSTHKNDRADPRRKPQGRGPPLLRPAAGAQLAAPLTGASRASFRARPNPFSLHSERSVR